MRTGDGAETVLEASEQLRRINGDRHLPAVPAAPEREIQADRTDRECQGEDVA
jgi:hypothetical protein